jgi:uncharacterized membrane-anchored protein YhcB (DUF1043 family)
MGMGPDLIGYLVAAGLAVAAAAFFVGRVTGGGAKRRRELEQQLANAHEEISRLAAQMEDLLEQLRIAREEHEAYRLDVVDHFSGTSDLLRDLTVQYRSVYEHLTKGASTLCPEGFVGLTEGLPVPEIAEPADEFPVPDIEEPPAELEIEDEVESFEATEPEALSGDSERNASIPPG